FRSTNDQPSTVSKPFWIRVIRGSPLSALPRTWGGASRCFLSGFLLRFFFFSSGNVIALLLLILPNPLVYDSRNLHLRSVIGFRRALGNIQVIGQLGPGDGELVMPVRNRARWIAFFDQSDFRPRRKTNDARINLE